MGAPNKDAVYEALREKGIRAIKVTERIQPVIRKGFAGLRKRDMVLIAVFALCLATGAWYLAARSVKEGAATTTANQTVEQSNSRTISSGVIQLAQPRPRRWLELPKGFDLAGVFKHKHEQYLVQFAIPGVVSQNAGAAIAPDVAQDFFDNLNAGIIISEKDDPAVAELKRIVAGMKEDAKKYLTMPQGIERLGIWLEERQTMEKVYREQYSKRVQRGELTKEDVNAILSAMGLELIK